VIDHVEAFAKGGAHDDANFVAACNKCNARKTDSDANVYRQYNPKRLVHGKYGEPKDWDGLVSLFLVLATDDARLSPAELRWRAALTKHLGLR
jgi:HNH endonuclease